jgi:hypothetical protein
MRPDSCLKKQKSRFNLYPGGRIHYRFQGANESGYRLKRLRYLPRQQLNYAIVCSDVSSPKARLVKHDPYH